MPKSMKPSNRMLRTGIIGAVITAICCFTPVLLILLGAVGMGAMTGYLDYVLFPALAGFLGLIALGYVRRQQRTPTANANSERQQRTPTANANSERQQRTQTVNDNSE